MFADDTKVFRNINSIEDMDTLQRDLGELENWSKKWLLEFHPGKCKVLTVGNRHLPLYNYKLHNTDIKYVVKEKDIGVTVDCQLNFEEHMNEKINKANSIMGLIRRTFTYLDEKTFLILFKALVRPHLEYANAIWYPYKIKHITSIENVQRRATKQIPGMKDKSYEDRLRALKLPTLAYRRLRGDMIEVYKMMSGLYDTAVPPLLQVYNTRTRGHSKKLFHNRVRKSLRQNFFTNRVISAWNSLPESVINSIKLQSFERKLDNHWQNQDVFYNITKPTWKLEMKTTSRI